MFAWDFCNETLCLLFIFLVVTTNQQSVDVDLNIRQKYPTDKSDMAETSKISRNEESTKTGNAQSLPVTELQQGLYNEDPDSKSEHPNLIRVIEAQLQDNNEGNNNEDQHQKRQVELDSIIQQVFPQNSIKEYESKDLKNYPYSQSEQKINQGDPIVGVPHRKPRKKSFAKSGLPERNVLKRKRLLKHLRPPTFRSSQPDTNEISEHNSEELLHSILESIDQENSKNGNSIKHAFLTKTTTYNISKLHENKQNRSFLIEKIVNYSTNINMLHPENIPTNYTDSHSSVLQTVLNLGQLDNNADEATSIEENEKQSYRSLDDEEDISHDFVGSQGKFDVSNEDEMSKKLLEEDHQAPSEFLGGQYVHHPNKSQNIDSKQTYKHSDAIESADFVGGQYIGIIKEKDDESLDSKDPKNDLFDFVGGQFVDQPFRSDENPSGTSRNDIKKTSGHVIDQQTTSEYDDTPSTVTAETPTHNPLHDIPTLSLTQELVDIEQDKNQPSNNILKAREKIEKEEGGDKAGKILKTLNDSKEFPTNGKITLPKISPKTVKPKTSLTDRNSKPQDNNFNPQNSNVKKPDSEIQSDNKYGSTTLSDEIKDTDKVLLDGGKKSFKQDSDDLQMVKKSQVSPPKARFDDNYKKPSKATGAKIKKIEPTIPEKNNQSSEIGDFQNGKITDDNLEQPYKNSEILRDKKQPFIVVNPTSYEIPEISSKEKSNNIVLGLPMSDEEGNYSSEGSVEGQSATTPEVSEILSAEIEEYSDTPKNFVGLKPTNNLKDNQYQTATGKLIEEANEFSSSDETTQSYGDEWVGSINTLQPISYGESLLFTDRDLDHVVGEASVLQSQFRNGSNNKSADQLSNEKPIDQDQTITTLIDDVELYAGKATVSVPPELQTTEKYDSETNYVHRPFEIVSSDSKEENPTELCIPVTKQNYPTLLDLLSGNLYLEKDGKKMKLQIEENSMRLCNSGKKICKLLFNLKNENEPSISQEMFQTPESNNINKGLNSKSKNGKRHISMEDEDFGTPESKTDIKTQENGEECNRSQEAMKELSDENEVIILTLNQAANNHSVLKFNLTENLNPTKPPEDVKSPPVQSMFVRLPVPYKTPGFGVQNIENVDHNKDKDAPQTNGEKITLYSLDSPHHKFGFQKGIRLARKIHHKRDSPGHIGGACGCNNPLLLSPSPIPDYRHFVGKRLAILTNMVSTIKDWATEEALRPK